MERIFFVSHDYPPNGRSSAMERTMFEEAKGLYMHHLVKEGDLDDIVLTLQERQNAYSKSMKSRKTVTIDHKPSPGYVSGGKFHYIHIGNSSLTLIEVQGEIPQN